MTDKIDELMAIIANEVAAAEYGAFDRIRKALEAALKPGGEPVARFNWNAGGFEWLTKYNFEKHNMQPLYLAAPSAQTPPPWLTDEQVGMLTVFDGLHHVEAPVLAAFIRHIEQAHGITGEKT